jgi:hypothetical protein
MPQSTVLTYQEVSHEIPNLYSGGFRIPASSRPRGIRSGHTQSPMRGPIVDANKDARNTSSVGTNHPSATDEARNGDGNGRCIARVNAEEEV